MHIKNLGTCFYNFWGIFRKMIKNRLFWKGAKMTFLRCLKHFFLKKTKNYEWFWSHSDLTWRKFSIKCFLAKNHYKANNFRLKTRKFFFQVINAFFWPGKIVNKKFFLKNFLWPHKTRSKKGQKIENLNFEFRGSGPFFQQTTPNCTKILILNYLSLLRK